MLKHRSAIVILIMLIDVHIKFAKILCTCSKILCTCSNMYLFKYFYVLVQIFLCTCSNISMYLFKYFYRDESFQD